MNVTIAQVTPLVKKISKGTRRSNCDIALAVPYTDIAVANNAARTVLGNRVMIGAQNCHWERTGAYTGEISAEMVHEIGSRFAIVGHSERRQYLGETNEMVAKRAKAALDEGMGVIVCVGETEEERKAGKTFDVLKTQIEESLHNVFQDKMNLCIAYEPVWAIGTGKTATPEDAQEACAYIRSLLKDKKIKIIYGGSIKPTNALELFKQPDIDGGLVGGSSLIPDEFISIVNQIPQSKMLR